MCNEFVYFFKVIHLKRFQFMNGRWVKSNKIVNFPMENFDPSDFVVKRSSSTGSCDTGQHGSSVRTVNVQTVMEDSLPLPGNSVPQASASAYSDKVSG